MKTILGKQYKDWKWHQAKKIIFKSGLNFRIIPLTIDHLFFNKSGELRTICNSATNRAHFSNEVIYYSFYISQNKDEVIIPKWAKKFSPEFFLFLERKGVKFKYINTKSKLFDWNHIYHFNYLNKHPFNLNHYFASNKKKYIYFISRKGNARRSILNDEELYKNLKNEISKVTNTEIKYINMEGKTLNVLENALFFENVEGIISIHGQVLGNLVYMKEKSNILEILPFNFHKQYFRKYCNACDINYKYYTCKKESSSNSPDGLRFPRDSIIKLSNSEINDITKLYVSFY